jgi:hypothetical protein
MRSYTAYAVETDYINGPKSLNLKHSLVLKGIVRFKSVIQFVERHQRCEFCTEHEGSHSINFYTFSR